MNYKKYTFLFSLLCLMSLNVIAEEYKNVGNMTDEEYRMVRNAQATHTECMDESAISHLQTQTDIRVVADFAMKDCSHILEEIYNTLAASNYEPKAISRFLGSISNKSANRLLSNLMKYMAARGQ
jgi:hypothetical protein